MSCLGFARVTMVWIIVRHVHCSNATDGWIKYGPHYRLSANGLAIHRAIYRRASANVSTGADPSANGTVNGGNLDYKVEIDDGQHGCSFAGTNQDVMRLWRALERTQILNITVNNATLSSSYAIMEFHDYKQEVDFIFLPFPVKYLGDILSFSRDYVRSINNRSSVNTTTIDVPLFQQCLATMDNNDEVTRMRRLFYYMVFLLIPGGDSQFCLMETWRQLGAGVKSYRPWVGVCCRAAFVDIRRTRDFQNKVKQAKGDVDFEFECHEVDRMRDNIVTLAKIVSVIATLMSPLLLRLIPTQPWRHRHIVPLLHPRSSVRDGTMATHLIECTDEGRCDGEEVGYNR